MGWMVDGNFLLLITSLGDLILKNRTYVVIIGWGLSPSVMTTTHHGDL